MSKNSDEPSNEQRITDFNSSYEGLKTKILDGSITVEETRELYQVCNNIKGASVKDGAIRDIIEDLEKSGITSEKYHDFVSKLVEVETQIVSEQFPVNDQQDLQKQTKAMKQRCAEYMRNTSLAKVSMLHECTKNGLGHDIYKDLKVNNTEAATKKLQDFEVPDYLQDHYSTIKEFYRENNNEMGATTNLTFHSLTTSINEYAKIELEGAERNNIIRTSGKTCKTVYSPSIPGSRDRLLDQIPEAGTKVEIDFTKKEPPVLTREKPEIEQQETKQATFGQKVLNTFKRIGKNIQDVISKAFQKKESKPKESNTRPEVKGQKTPDQSQGVVKETKVSARPRSNAITAKPKNLDPTILAAATNARKNINSKSTTPSKTTPPAMSAQRKQQQDKNVGGRK